MTDYPDYSVKHARVLGIDDYGYYLIRRDGTTNPEMMSDDAKYCFKSAEAAYNALIRECKETVHEARLVWQHRCAELREIKRQKKQACKG